MKLNVFVNHVGYERRGPKRFLVASDAEIALFDTLFEVRDGTDRSLWEGELGPLGERNGTFYYAGGFDHLASPGADLQVIVTSRGKSFASYRFAVGDSLLWRLTKPVVLAWLRRARNTRANYSGDGEWKPNATLDDGKYLDVNGGWFERGTHGGALLAGSSLATWALFLCHDHDPTDPQVAAGLAWAAEWWKKLGAAFSELGGLPDSIGFPEDAGDLRTDPRLPFASRKLLAVMFFARFHRLTGDPEHIKHGMGVWEKVRERGGFEAGYLLPGAVEMYASTHDERFKEEAARLAGDLLDVGPAALAEFDPLLPGCLAHFAIRMKGVEAASRAEVALAGYMRGPLSRRADSPVEEGPRDPAERALRAWSALLTCRACPKRELLAYAVDQINWLLGMNPGNFCMMSGVGAGGEDAEKPGGAVRQAHGGAGVVTSPDARSSPLAGTAAYLMSLALL